MNKYFSCFLTFNYINLTFIFFRSKSLENSINIIKGMSGFNGFSFSSLDPDKIYIILILIVSILICFELDCFCNKGFVLFNNLLIF